MEPRSDEHGADVGSSREEGPRHDVGADLTRRAAPHGLERLRPGVVRVVLEGPVSEAQARALLGFGRAEARGTPPRVDVLAAVGGVGAVRGEARRVFRQGLEALPVGAVAIVGLGSAARLAARVFFRALRLARVGGRGLAFEVRFFRDEDEARRWLRV